MSAVDAFENSMLLLLFNNTAITNIGDATGLTCGTAGSAQVSLHTAALSDTTADLTVNECDYTGYSRQTVARTSGGWGISGTNPTIAANAALIQFGEMTAGASDTAVHLGCGLIATGNVIRLHADLDNDLIINNGVNPQFAASALDFSLD